MINVFLVPKKTKIWRAQVVKANNWVPNFLLKLGEKINTLTKTN